MPDFKDLAERAKADHEARVAERTRKASDMSGIITTVQQIAGLTGIATFGTAYFSLVPGPSPHSAMHGFAIVSGGFAVMALLATAAAYLCTHSRTATERAARKEQPAGAVRQRIAVRGRPPR